MIKMGMVGFFMSNLLEASGRMGARYLYLTVN